ncbi:MAG: biotin synthase-like enzyme [Candidatus Woesearchaeota archaeon]|jgi:biotin synthase-like enzyme
MNAKEIIDKNNSEHIVDKQELDTLIKQAHSIFQENFEPTTWLERSVFTNWTCGIADCKYCYLSTRPKLDRTAVRTEASILAEVLICREMGWDIGYITGGLRVETTEKMVELLNNIAKVYGEKTMMNYGPYTLSEIKAFEPHITGMGCAIESFDEELHKFICPSKPLKVLLKYFANVRDHTKLEKFITIILGIGEKMSDVEHVIKQVTDFNIDKVQLCFLKPQEKTVFDDVPPPDPNYMAWWIAKIRIAHPKIQIKIALIKERISDLSLYLEAGANSFSRYLIFNDFNSKFAHQLESECKKAGRTLKGNFTEIVEMDIPKIVSELKIKEKLKPAVEDKALQYYTKLQKLASMREIK